MTGLLSTNYNLTYALIASTFVGFLTLPLGYLFLKDSKLKSWLEKNFIGLCAGIMLGNALIDLLPEALKLEPNSKLISFCLLFGIIGFFLLEKTTVWFHHHDESHGEEPATKLILIGDSIHNFIDGVAIMLAFSANTHLGIITTFAIVLHEIPSEISDLSVLINKGMAIKRAIWFNFLTALTSIAGTITAYFLFTENVSVQAPLLAVTSGMFVYIACSDLIPDLHKEHRKNTAQTILIFLTGIILSMLTSLFE